MKNTTWTKQVFAERLSRLLGPWQIMLVGIICAGLATTVEAGPREQAKAIHDRLAGVPPTNAVLDQMEGLIAADPVGGPAAAADIAMQNPSFYNVTLKNFAAPWTNRDQSVFVPMNDYIATVIGMVRDNVDFSTLLSADVAYMAPGVNPGPSPTSNAHYEAIEAQNIDLSNPASFTSTAQSSVMAIPANATAGIMTSRAASEAFFVAGTNRAMFRFTLLNHMCNDMEQMMDFKLPPDMVRQDVSRSPGGDSRLFLNNCIGCHAGMDPLAGAFAYYNWNEETGRLEYTPTAVQSKYFNNDLNFPPGFRTPDDAWENRWRAGQNAYFGFVDVDSDGDGVGRGFGAKSLGEELGKSRAFASCQVKKVFRTVCVREPEDQAEWNWVESTTTSFINGGYSMKQVFADTAAHCTASLNP